MIPLRINLEPEEIPTHWYNVAADLTNPPAPPLAPDGNVVTPEQMGAIFQAMAVTAPGWPVPAGFGIGPS